MFIRLVFGFVRYGAEDRSLEPLVLEVSYHPDVSINLDEVQVLQGADCPIRFDSVAETKSLEAVRVPSVFPTSPEPEAA